MLRSVEEGLKKLGLSFNPFKDISPSDPNFDRLFVNRTKELYKLDLALEFYRNGVRKNVVLLGEPKIGKTTLLNFLVREISDKFTCIYFKFPPSIREFAEEIAEKLGEEVDEKSLREIGSYLIKLSEKHSGKVVVLMDNFEEMLKIEKEEMEEYIRVFRRSEFLIIAACTTDEWKELLGRYPILRNIFSEEILLETFGPEHSKELIMSRIDVASVGGEGPFDEEAVRLIGVYSFFVPGRTIDLANKVLFEAVSEGLDRIKGEFVKKVIFESPTIKKYLEGLSEKEVEALEAIIEIGEPVSFESLSKKLNVSRVTAAGYIQRLLEKGFVIHLESVGKRRYFALNDRFKQLLI